MPKRKIYLNKEQIKLITQKDVKTAYYLIEEEWKEPVRREEIVPEFTIVFINNDEVVVQDCIIQFI